MSLITRLECKILLFRWSGKTRVGRNKRIRIHRAYRYLHSDLVDLTWSLREIKPDGTKSQPTVITERVAFAGMERAIKRIEHRQLPSILNDFAKKIGEEL